VPITTVLPTDRLLRRVALPAWAYYRLAARLQRSRWDTELRRQGFPVDPFAIQWISPREIVRFRGGRRGRQRQGSRPGIHRDFGAIRDGNWDLDPAEYPPGHPLADLILANRFDQTVHYRSMHAHFIEGVPWKETPFIHEVIRRSRSGGFPWNAYCDAETTVRTCQRLDAIYTDMSRNGIKSHRQLLLESGERRPFIEVVNNEVLVDLGRDGEPLFVDGRHRLAFAKLLDLPSIPVVVVARHAAWVEQRCISVTGPGQRPLR
jgi:hypothetical protein